MESRSVVKNAKVRLKIATEKHKEEEHQLCNRVTNGFAAPPQFKEKRQEGLDHVHCLHAQFNQYFLGEQQ